MLCYVICPDSKNGGKQSIYGYKMVAFILQVTTQELISHFNGSLILQVRTRELISQDVFCKLTS